MSSPPPDHGNSPAGETLQESLAAGKRPELTSSLVTAPPHQDCPLPSANLQAKMTSQEQGQRNVQEDVAIGGKEEKRSRQRQGAGPKKGLSPVARKRNVQEDVAIRGKEEKRSRQRQGADPKKMKKTKKGLSPVARHHVVAAMLSRSLAVRASPTARQTSPAARRTSPKATPPTAAVLESYRTPTFIDNDFRAPLDVDMDENDVEEASDQDVEDSREHIFEDDVEGDEQDVEEEEDDDEVVSGNAFSIRALTSKFRSEAWKEYVPVIVNGKVSSGRCKHCDKMISAKRGAGTSALLKHLDRCKKRDCCILKSDKQLSDILSVLKSCAEMLFFYPPPLYIVRYVVLS